MVNKGFIGTVVLAVSSLVCSCSHTPQKEERLFTAIEWVNDTIVCVADTTQTKSLSISVLEEEIYSNNSFKGTWQHDVLTLIKNNSKDKLKIALYAARNGNQIPVRVKVSDAIDTSFIMKLTPIKETLTLSSIRGNCAPLVSSSSNPDYITDVKRWLFRKNEHLSDSLLNNMIGIIRELNRTQYNDFVTKVDIPVLKSFSGTQYTVTSDMIADYYILYACSSQKEINDFVEEIVSNDFELTATSLNRPLHCYRNTNSNGYKCITLIGINKDWSYQQQPLGLVAIDNIVIGNQNYNNSQIVLKNNVRVNIPSNKQQIIGDADIRITRSPGNGIACNVSFLTTFRGDIKSITIRRTRELCYYSPYLGYDSETPGPKDFVIYTNKETSPHVFNIKLHLEDGDNFIPYIIEDYHGNKHEGKLIHRASFKRSDAPQINIDNNIDIYN